MRIFVQTCIGILILMLIVTVTPMGSLGYYVAVVFFAFPLIIHSMNSISRKKYIQTLEKKDRYFLKGIREMRVFSYMWRIIGDFACALVLPAMLYLSDGADILTLAVLIPLAVIARVLIVRFSSYKKIYSTYRNRNFIHLILMTMSSCLYPFIWMAFYSEYNVIFCIGELEDLRGSNIGYLIAYLVDWCNSIVSIFMNQNTIWILSLVFVSGGLLFCSLYNFFLAFLLPKEDFEKLFCVGDNKIENTNMQV